MTTVYDWLYQEEPHIAEIATLEQSVEEIQLDEALRPESLDGFIGQTPLIEDLRVYIEEHKITGEPLGHMLFSGPPGLGKTSLASLIAGEMGTDMVAVSGPRVKGMGDLLALLIPMCDGDVLFLDEIHALPRHVEETFYTYLEDGYLDVMLGENITASATRLEYPRLPRVTVVGATTHTGQMDTPFRDRFDFDGHLELYNKQDLKRIVIRAAYTMDLPIDEQAAAGIARRSRGTPRKAIKLLKACRSHAVVMGEERITPQRAEFVFEQKGLDKAGLDRRERHYLKVLIERFQGGTVGVKNLSAVLGQALDTVEEIESYLICAGFLVKMTDGRMITTKGLKHMGYEIGDLKEVK